jgi:hypothetical protein
MYVKFKTYNLNMNYGRPSIRIRVCLGRGEGINIYVKILSKVLDQTNLKKKNNRSNNENSYHRNAQ